MPEINSTLSRFAGNPKLQNLNAELKKKIKEAYEQNKDKISKFLEGAWEKTNNKDDVLFELVFCLCTPQSRAPSCRRAVTLMKKTGKLYNGSKIEILKYISEVRFNKTKSEWIILARDNFEQIWQKVQEMKNDPRPLREWLVENVKGYGYKEASHFLRNIGLGDQLAIWDRHTLRTMQNLGLMGDAKSLSKKVYLEYEQHFLELAELFGLKPVELDISIWLMESKNPEIM